MDNVEPTPDPRPELLKKQVREYLAAHETLAIVEKALVAAQSKREAKLHQLNDFTEAVLKLVDEEKTFLVKSEEGTKVVIIRRANDTDNFIVTILNCEEA